MANKLIQLKDGNDNLYPTEYVETGAITPATGWTVEASFLRKAGNVVSILLNIKGGTLGSGWTVLGSIPSGFRPPNTTDFVGIDNVTCLGTQCQVTSSGYIQVYPRSGLNNNIRLSVTYIVN